MGKLWVIIALLLTSACGGDNARQYSVMDTERDRSIDYQVYLPATGERHPLLVISHGSGGDFRSLGWIIRAMLERGYAVVAFNHPLNSAVDNTPEGVARVWDRPQDVSHVLDHMQLQPELVTLIDFDRVGAIGHSSGGYTVIASAGAIFDGQGMVAYCTGPERGPDCDLVGEDVTVDYTGSSDSYRDPRVKAVVALAPAVGPAMAPDGLAAVDIPVMIVASLDDELLPHDKHAMHYARHIPGVQLVTLPRGGHFVYMECNPMTHIADWFIEELDLCADPPGTSRAQVQAEMIPGITAFLDQNLQSG